MTEVSTLATNVGAGIAAGLLYGLLWYARAHYQSGERSPWRTFQPAKLAGTLLVGAAVGAAFGLTGVEPTEANIMAAMAANAGLVALLEPPLKVAFQKLGWFEQYAGRRETPSHAMEDRPR